MLLLKQLMTSLGSFNIDCRQDGAVLPSQPRSAYLFNTTIAGIERAGALLLIGANPRLEAAVLNARIRKRWRGAEPFPIGLLGEQADLTYEYEYLGNDPRKLEALAAGDHPFAGVLREAERPMLILGMGALARPDGPAILDCARRIAEQTGMISGNSWNGFNVLHTAAARVGGLDVGFVPGNGARDVRGILGRRCCRRYRIRLPAWRG